MAADPPQPGRPLWCLAASCTSGGGSSPSAKGSSDATPSSGPGSSSATIELGTLEGKLLFTRAGGKFGDETIFTAADGTHQQRISGFGTTCCPRWTTNGSRILMSALAADGRITTGITGPDGSHLRRVPLPSGTLNLGCSQAFSLRTGRVACEGWSDKNPRLKGIYTVRAADGGDLVRMTSSSGEQGDRPMDFSPDGSRIPLDGR